MQSYLVALALSGLTSAFTATQVKDDLDTHPWRPAPSAPLAKAPPQTSPASVKQPPQTAPGNVSQESATVSGAGSWQLQIAALSSVDAAKAEQKRIEKILGPGKVEVLSEGSVHRVRYGSYATKDAAETAREDLRAKGIEGFPVKKN